MEVELMVTKRDNRQPTIDDNRQGEYRAICLWKMVTGQVEFCNYCPFSKAVVLNYCMHRTHECSLNTYRQMIITNITQVYLNEQRIEVVNYRTKLLVPVRIQATFHLKRQNLIKYHIILWIFEEFYRR